MPRARASSASANFSALPPPDFGLKIRTGVLGRRRGRQLCTLAHRDSRACAGDHDTADDQRDFDRAVVHEHQDRRGERDRRPARGRRLGPRRAAGSRTSRPAPRRRPGRGRPGLAGTPGRDDHARGPGRRSSDQQRSGCREPSAAHRIISPHGLRPTPNPSHRQATRLASRRRARRPRRLRGDRTDADARARHGDVPPHGRGGLLATVARGGGDHRRGRRTPRTACCEGRPRLGRGHRDRREPRAEAAGGPPAPGPRRRAGPARATDEDAGLDLVPVRPHRRRLRLRDRSRSRSAGGLDPAPGTRRARSRTRACTPGCTTPATSSSAPSRGPSWPG